MIRFLAAVCAAALITAGGLAGVSARAAEAPLQETPAVPAAYSIERAIGVFRSHGFTDIGHLELDGAGGWRGQAIKYDQRWDVEIDARGNFTGAAVGARGDLRPARKRQAPRLQLFLVLR